MISSPMTSPTSCNQRKSPAGKPWTPEEHERFLLALELYPSGPWKYISEYVGTRTTRQTMTHAQKYRQKMERRQKRLARTGRSVCTETLPPINLTPSIESIDPEPFSPVSVNQSEVFDLYEEMMHSMLPTIMDSQLYFYNPCVYESNTLPLRVQEDEDILLSLFAAPGKQHGVVETDIEYDQLWTV